MTISTNQLQAPTLTEEEYGELLHRLRNAVSANARQNSTVLVVNKGDEALLQLDGRTGWHFPQDEDGNYPGFYPADSSAAVAHLEELRGKGAEYLVIPAPAFWWLEHYPQFAQHLEMNYRIVARDDSTCLIFRLKEPEAERDPAPRSPQGHFTRQLSSFLDALLPLQTSVILVGTGDPHLGELEGRRESQVLHIENGPAHGTTRERHAQRIEYLGQRHAAGAEFLVVRGATGEHAHDYEEFVHEVAKHYRQLAHQERFCTVLDLGVPLVDNDQKPPRSALGRLLAGLRRALGTLRRSFQMGGNSGSA